jgi:hypothetical protein
MVQTFASTVTNLANMPIQMANTALSGIADMGRSMGLPDVIPAGIPEISPASLPALPFDVSQLPALPAGLPALPAMPAGLPALPGMAAQNTYGYRSASGPGAAYSKGGYNDGRDQPASYVHAPGTVAGNNLDFQVETLTNQHYAGRKARSNSLDFEVIGA